MRQVAMGYNSAPSDPEDQNADAGGTDAVQYCWAAAMALREAPAAVPGGYMHRGAGASNRISSWGHRWLEPVPLVYMPPPIYSGGSQQRFITTPEIVETVVPVTAGAVTWSGQSVTPTLVVTVSAAATAWSGPDGNSESDGPRHRCGGDLDRANHVTVATVVPVTTGSVTWTGQDGHGESHGSVTTGSVQWQGQTVNIAIATVVPVATGPLRGPVKRSPNESRSRLPRGSLTFNGDRNGSTLGPGHRWIGGVDRANGHRIGTQYHVRSCYRWCCGL